MGEARKRVSVVAMACAAMSLAVSLGQEQPLESGCGQPRSVALAVETGFTTTVTCGASAGGELQGPARLLFGQLLDVNRASALALNALPGVGPVRAAALIRGREHQAYSGLGDLRRVKGVGRVTVRAMKRWVMFGPDSRTAGQRGL